MASDLISGGAADAKASTSLLLRLRLELDGARVPVHLADSVETGEGTGPARVVQFDAGQ